MKATRPPDPAAARHEADVRIGPMRAVPALLREAGIAPLPLLAACGLRLSAFDDADARVPFAAAARMLHDAARATGHEDFGLLVGQRAGADSLGLLSLLMQRAPSVGNALQGLARHLTLQDRGAVVYLSTGRPQRAALGYAVHDETTPGLGLIYDLAMTLALAVLRGLCGPQWHALEVRLPHARPKRPDLWRRHFAAPVVFDATGAELWFDAGWLQHPPPLADPAAQLDLLRAAQRSQALQAQRWTERTQHVALALVKTGALSADAVAHVLSLHPRTLRRRLADEGSRLQTLISEARHHLACQLLRETRLPLAEVAEAVGYADVTAFVRAFRGRAGCAPGQWRARAAAQAT
jgi:AraC-like DNA-binding protein